LSKFAIYQVLARSFGNSNNQAKVNGSIEENGCGKLNDFSIKALENIKELGITHIWYTGIIRHSSTTIYPNIPTSNPSIVKGKAGSPYAITDYYDIHPDLAEHVPNRMIEFEALVERTHKQDLKVIIDFIPNHLARDYKSIMQPKGTESFGQTDNQDLSFNPQNNFYYFPSESLTLPFPSDYKENPAKVSGNDVFNAFPQEHDWYETIKLNYGIDYLDGNSKHFHPTPKTWKLMRDVLLYWTKKGIDGFRCDMVEMVPVEFWEWAIPQVKKANPDIIFIAEIYNPDLYKSYVNIGGFDYLYDKVGLYDSLRSIIEGKQTAKEISKVWQQLDGLDDKMLRFLENHDEQRISSRFFAENPEKAIPAFFLTATMHKNPFLLYFGQEFGETANGESGFSGDDGRTSLFDYGSVPSIQKWRVDTQFNSIKLSKETQHLYKNYQNITKFSLSEEAIKQGEFYDLMWANKDNSSFNSEAVFAFLRTSQTQKLLCLCNFSEESLSFKIQIPEHAFEFCKIKSAKLLNFNFTEKFANTNQNINGLELIEKGIPLKLEGYSYAAYQF
jgi:glycosidase